MVGFTGAFVALSLLPPTALPGLLRSLISAALALGVFAAWRFLVWEKPRPKL